MPRVSVITPTYNHAEFIGECIESVLAQTFSDWEMLIVDDGSTDGTGEVVERYDDPRIHLFRKSNGGIMKLAEGYNLALGEAKGDLLAILEGDDYWPANKLELQVPEFDAPEVVLVSGFAQIVDENHLEIGRVPGDAMPEAVQLNRPVGAATRAMLNPMSLNFTFPVATMLRRSAVERIGGFRQPDDLPLLDYPTFLALSFEGEFRFVHQTCGFWRRHAASTTTSRFPQILNGCYRDGMTWAQAHGDRIGLTDEELDGIEARWEDFQYARCTTIGRLLSEERRFKEANRAFLLASRYRQRRRNRLVANGLALLSALHLPVRHAIWLTMPEERGQPWKERLYVGNDPVVRASDLAQPWPIYRHPTRGGTVP